MRIYFNNHLSFSFQEIANFDTEEIDAIKDIYSKQAIYFCNEWLNGKETFTLQTSGSTGKPKSILIHRKQMQASAQMTAQALGLQKGDNALVCLNTAYIAGKMMLVRGLEIGMNLFVVAPSSNPIQNLVLPPDYLLDFCALVPLQLLTILKGENLENQLLMLNQMKAMIVGGAPVNAELEKLLQVISVPIYATYGMTETVSHIALKRLNGESKSPYYQALPNTEIGQDERGCLTIISPVTNFEKIITNDSIKIIDNQTFEWLGRVDNVINSGGVKIQIENLENEIDNAMNSLKISKRFAVIGLADDKFGEVLALILEGEKLDYNIENQIIDTLNSKLSKYEVPKKILYLAQFPETETAKIDRLKIKTLL